MTREDAIEKWVIPALKNTWNEKKCAEILKALEQDTCDDCISREDALMCLTGEWTELTDEVIDRFIKRIKNLPLMVLPKPVERDDAISRQAAIDSVVLVPIAPLFKGDNVHYERVVFENVIKNLPPVTPAEKVGCSENPNKWIPVSERLPEIHKDVILSLRSLDIGVGFRAKTEPYFYCYCRGVDSCYIDPKNVLAWMPLPEPYKASPTGAEGSE